MKQCKTCGGLIFDRDDIKRGNITFSGEVYHCLNLAKAKKYFEENLLDGQDVEQSHNSFMEKVRIVQEWFKDEEVDVPDTVIGRFAVRIGRLIDRQIDEDNKRFLEMIGEDEYQEITQPTQSYDYGCIRLNAVYAGRVPTVIRHTPQQEIRNELRAELRNKVNKG